MAGGIVVLVAVVALMGSAARAQMVDPQLSASEPNVSESAGQVVVTVSKLHPGRIVYRTSDGSSDGNAVASEDGSAIASEDYVPVSGELVFPTPGSQTVTIPILDDERFERPEEFTFAAWEGDDVNVADSRAWSSRYLTIGIADDDEDPFDEGETSCVPSPCASTDGSSGRVAPSARTVGAPSTSSDAGASRAPVPPPAAAVVGATATTPSARDLQVALPQEALRPGSGFELSTDIPVQTAPEREQATVRNDWAAIATAAALGTAAVVTMRRQRRWSPKRP
ncbi:MAG: hypothetical protein M3394_00740 [Actinomycetota bacterium]|nr:hypothetical protein [Actinomycetota bacterium]